MTTITTPPAIELPSSPVWASALVVAVAPIIASIDDISYTASWLGREN